MKKHYLLLAAVFSLAALGSSVSAQTTYTWNQTGFTTWSTSTNWTPARITPAAADILVFNNGAFTTATGVPAQQIGQLLVSGGTALTLQPAAGVIALTILGDNGSDLLVSSGSTLRINGGDTNTNVVRIFLATGTTGSISGVMTFTTAEHKLDAADASGIVFNAGSIFTDSGSAAGNSFTNAGTPNAIVFASGSTYHGANPFGLDAPASKAVFQTGSLYRHQSTTSPSLSGRTLANFELNFVNVTVTGTSAVSIDNLFVNFGVLNFNMTGNPGHSIKGNISVSSGGILNFAPATSSTVNLNGTSTQTINNSGQIILNDADQTIVVNNPNGITLARNLDFRNGTLKFMAGNITTGVNRLFIDAPATLIRTSGHVVGNLQKFFSAPGSKTFEVGTANGYSPVTVNSMTQSAYTISATEGPHPSVNAAASIQRFWTIIPNVGASADLTFQYLAADVVGNEANYKVVRISEGNPTAFPSSVINTTAHTASLAGVTGFSDWTASEDVTPTAPFGDLTGRVTSTANGLGISGVVFRLTGTQNRKTITDANGNYRFDNVDTSGSYTLTPSRSNFVFSPNQRFLSQLGNHTEVAFVGFPQGTTINPLDTPEYFVRQHYLDFLSREPDEPGFNFWSDQIISCGSDSVCLDRRTVNVSAAYFLSIEFQETGGLVTSLYRTSFERRPLYSEFVPDSQTVGMNVIVGQSGWEQLLEANKQAFVNAWVQRPAFVSAYGSLPNDVYVDTLISHTGVSFTAAERNALVDSLNQTGTRAAVLRQIAEDPRFKSLKFNETFVMMEYFGYLRRDPDESGFQFWLNKLNQFNGNFEQADMVKSFIVSGEYRDRFPN